MERFGGKKKVKMNWCLTIRKQTLWQAVSGEPKLNIRTYEGGPWWLEVFLLFITKYIVFEGNSYLPSQEERERNNLLEK